MCLIGIPAASEEGPLRCDGYRELLRAAVLRSSVYRDQGSTSGASASDGGIMMASQSDMAEL